MSYKCKWCGKKEFPTRDSAIKHLKVCPQRPENTEREHDGDDDFLAEALIASGIISFLRDDDDDDRYSPDSGGGGFDGGDFGGGGSSGDF
jgi:hypothetical protein